MKHREANRANGTGGVFTTLVAAAGRRHASELAESSARSQVPARAIKYDLLYNVS